MKPASTPMRRATPAECRKQAWKDTGHCLFVLWCAASYFPLQSASLLQWAIFILFATFACGCAKSAIAGFLLTRHFGQTVTYRIGPRGHELWQRTVTYRIPRVPAKPKDPPPASTIITLGWTVATAILLLLTCIASTQTLLARIAYIVADIVLVVYTAYNWKLIAQQKRQRSLARARNTAP